MHLKHFDLIPGPKASFPIMTSQDVQEIVEYNLNEFVSYYSSFSQVKQISPAIEDGFYKAVWRYQRDGSPNYLEFEVTPLDSRQGKNAVWGGFIISIIGNSYEPFIDFWEALLKKYPVIYAHGDDLHMYTIEEFKREITTTAASL